MASKSSSAPLPQAALLVCLLAPAVLPHSTFLGASRAPAPPATAAAAAAASALGAPLPPQPLAGGAAPRLRIAAGVVALALGAAAAAGRRAAGGRAARCGRAASTRQQIREMEALCHSEDPGDAGSRSGGWWQQIRDRSSRSWFSFGRKKEESKPEPAVLGLEELPEDLRALVEESRALALRVAELDVLTALKHERASEQAAEASGDAMPAAQEGAAQPEPAAAGEQTAAETAEAAVEVQEPEEEVLAAEAVQEQPALEEESAIEAQAAPEEQAGMEEQDVVEAATELLDKQSDTLNKVLATARELGADNKRLKEDLQAAQKMCYELLCQDLQAAKATEAQAA